jgi:Co/Zn/Cd efflux system component
VSAEPDTQHNEGGHDHGLDHDNGHGHGGTGRHGHSHGLVDRSIVRSREGVKAVSVSLAVLAIAAGIQLAIFTLSGSVALLADLIHNFGDALTAIPLGIAFFLRSVRGEKAAGLAVVLAIFISAFVALYETILRFIHPQHLTHLWCSLPQASSASSATRSRRRYACGPASGSPARR